MDQSKTGRYIAQKRKELGLLQKDIAFKLGISEKTVSKWECGKGLPEVVFMEPLCTILGITVNELLAGEDIPLTKLLRSIDISRLELVKQLEFEQLKMRLYKLYGIEPDSMDISENGAGGITYFVAQGDKKYVVKYPSDNEMNHPDIEADICRKLICGNIPACRFIADKNGNFISNDETGRRFTVQHFIDGVTYGYNEAPVELQAKSAVMLSRIHTAMKDMENIPEGINADFFKYRKPETTYTAYQHTLKRALDSGDIQTADRIRSNMNIISEMTDFKFSADKFTCGNTHGDYNISQIIWKDNEINAVIDWTCACSHPYIWETVRSYVYMAPEIKYGEINIESLIKYISAYLEHGNLKKYDIENAGNLFFFFLAVCDFYGQYYDSLTKNRYIYLKQADMASKLLVWFKYHSDELNKRLCELSQYQHYKNKLLRFYDSQGRLIQYPVKKPMREIALKKIAECFEYEKKYTEKEVNTIILHNISFSDFALIRREMYQFRLLNRKSDGSEYWRE